MKRLLLVRHAKSSWEDMKLEDIDRPLNKRGKKDAPTMGLRLKKMKILPDILISSPAKRALSTAKKIAEKINYPKKNILQENLLYHGTNQDLIKIVKNLPDNAESVMLFGHNPGFTDFANRLCKINISNIPTTGIVAIDFQINKWSKADYGMGELVFFDYPKKQAQIN